jgi:hypothetical protein
VINRGHENRNPSASIPKSGGTMTENRAAGGRKAGNDWKEIRRKVDEKPQRIEQKDTSSAAATKKSVNHLSVRRIQCSRQL